jgi:hypothetical protein
VPAAVTGVQVREVLVFECCGGQSLSNSHAESMLDGGFVGHEVKCKKPREGIRRAMPLLRASVDSRAANTPPDGVCVAHYAAAGLHVGREGNNQLCGLLNNSSTHAAVKTFSGDRTAMHTKSCRHGIVWMHD